MGVEFTTLVPLRPEREQALCWLLEGRSVPLYREVLADLETPVSAYLKIARGPYSFLLESVEGGERVARYDKIHLFGFDNGAERYNEAETIEPGETIVTFDAPCGRVGLSVCYDLRFPQLFRAQAMAGAEVLTVPAAFTRQTGEAHWHVLLRARAIENRRIVILRFRKGASGAIIDHLSAARAGGGSQKIGAHPALGRDDMIAVHPLAPQGLERPRTEGIVR